MKPEIVVARVFGVPVDSVHDGVSNTSLAEWDSVAHMELILELEAAYGVSVSPQDALDMTDVGAIKRVLSRYGAAW